MSADRPLAVEQARRLILAEVVPSGAEQVSLAECLSRVTAVGVVAAGPVPPFDSSAMDGYAVRSGDVPAAGRPLAIVGESSAGHPAARGPQPGEALRISTGAVVPAGADTVIPLEQAREEEGVVVPTAAPVLAGAHVRRAGEDIAAGSEVLPAGHSIGPAEIGVLASLGVEAVECARRPALAVLTSGDELLGPGEAAAPGLIYDSSRFTLVAMAREAGAEAVHAGVLPDEPRAIRTAIEGALGSDLVVIAGGVSVGPHDHVKGALAELGVEQLFWRVALRPGGPTWAGALRRAGRRPTLVFGLPGNPVSAMVTFRLFARPALLAIVGLDPAQGRTSAVLAERYEKDVGKAHFLRCRLERAEDGWRAHLTRSAQGSHVLTSMLGADALVEVPADVDRVEAGERLTVELLR